MEMMATKNQELPAPARPPHHHIDLGNHKPILLGDKPDFVLKVMYSGKENDACQDSRDYLLDLWKRNHALRRFYFLYREWSYDSLPSTLRSHTDATLMELLAAHPQKATEVFLSTILMLHMHPDYQPKRTDEIRKLVQWLADHVCEGGCILKPLDAELCFPCQADKVLLYDSPTDESTKVALWYLAEIAKLRRCRSTEDN